MLVLVCLVIMLILTQDRCTICAECTICSENRIEHTRRISLVTLVMWNLVSIDLETVLVSVQDRCTVCAKRSSEIILYAPMLHLGDEAQVDTCFGLFRDSANLDAR
jgi:hypothetical protein